MSKLNEQLETEKLELLSVVERKNQEIDRLNGKQILIIIRLIIFIELNIIFDIRILLFSLV